jgi:hypothetical protein
VAEVDVSKHPHLRGLEAWELLVSREDVVAEENDVHMADTSCLVACRREHRKADSNPWVDRALSRLVVVGASSVGCYDVRGYRDLLVDRYTRGSSHWDLCP